MSRLFLPWTGACAVLSLVVPLACGSAFTAGSPSGADGGSEASGGDGSPPLDGPASDGSQNPDGVTTGEGGGEASAPGTVVYVSTATGSDANDGTAPDKPKATIAAALLRARSIGAVAQVHVCKGLYPETALTLTQSIPLLGAYDCVSWNRPPGYGYPTFDPTTLTSIVNANAAAQAATLLVTGGVTSSGIVDGFYIAGATTSPAATLALEVLGGSSPLITNDAINGGGGNGGASGAGSTGVSILDGSPEVRSCAVTGGTGTGNPGSLGIGIASTGSPYVHDLIVSGGTGTPTSLTANDAAVGVLIGSSATQATALRGLTVYGSDNAGTTAVVGSTVGIVVYGTSLTVDIESSSVHGGKGSAGSTSSSAIAIQNPGGTTRVLGDRIYGGVRTGPSSQTYGVEAVQGGNLSVNNCEIHGGTVATSTGAFSVGVGVQAAPSLTLTFDTIYSGQGPGGAISIASGVHGVVVTDDLLAGGGPGAAEVAIDMGSCGGQLATLDHTAFVNFDDLYECASGTPATTITLMAVALPGISTAGDLEIQQPGASCAASPSCVPDPSCPASPASCLPSVFGASWTSDDGFTGLFDGAPVVSDAMPLLRGWTLPPNSPCAIARGGTQVNGVNADLFGQTRSSTKPTIGADEYVLTVCAN